MSFKVISVVLYTLLLGRWKYPLDLLRIKSNIKPLLSHLEVIKKKEEVQNLWTFYYVFAGLIISIVFNCIKSCGFFFFP